MSQEERRYLLAFPTNIPNRGRSGPDQISNRLMSGVGNPNGGEFSGPEQLGQPLGIPPVRLNPVTPPLWYQGRCNDNAGMTEARQPTVKAIARWPGLIAKVEALILATQPGDQLARRFLGGIDLPKISQLPIPTALRHGHRIPQLRYIQSNVRFAILPHGSPSS
jgi:hypothetical protein